MNYIAPDNKSAWSYQTQIKATLPNGTELWNVTDYSRTTSKLQTKLFEPFALKALRNGVVHPNNVVVLNNVPKGTTDLVSIAVVEIQQAF